MRNIILGGLFLLMNGIMEGADQNYNNSLTKSEPEPSTVLSRSFPKQQNNLSRSDEVIVITPNAFREGLKPWIEWRQQQGYHIHLVTTNDPNQNDLSSLDSSHSVVSDSLSSKELNPNELVLQIRNTILFLATQKKISAVLLIGDACPSNPSGSWSNIIPTPRVQAQVISRFGSEDHIGSDSWYTDLDNDGFPDIPVGRFPVRTLEELSAVINKTIAYETLIPSGDWQRRINFVAGVGGFGLLDPVIDSVVRKLISSLLPSEYISTFTQANWKSSFCPYPPQFGDIAISRLNEGALLWVYMGHGFHQGLDQIQTPQGNYPILDIKDLPLINCTRGYPIVFFFACYTGALDVYEESLAEEFVLAPKGPVAVLAASRLSMPYGMAVFGQELLDSAFSSNKKGTLGEMIMNAKKKMYLGDTFIKKTSGNTVIQNLSEKAEPEKTEPKKSEPEKTVSREAEKEPLARQKSKEEVRALLDQTARTFDPSSKELDRQLLDHVHSINLLGDPLLHVRFPETIEIEAPEIALSAHSIKVSGTLPLEYKNETMTVVVELSLPRQKSGIRKPSRKTFELSLETEKEFQTTYQGANNLVITEVRGKTEQGRFNVTLPLPEGISGTHIIRVLLQNERYTLVGGRVLTIRPFDTSVPRPSGYQLKEEKNGSKQ